jgi:hypothetical protein
MLSAWATSDLKISPQNNGQGQFIHRWTYTSADQDLDATWIDIYEVIKRANVILSQIDELQVDPDQEELKNDIKGEALAIRAMAHLDLYRIYGQRFDESSLAVPYVTDPGIFNTPSRATGPELLSNIEADLLEARDLLIDDGDLFRASVPMVNGMLTRMAVWGEDWDKAITYGEATLNGAPELADDATYVSMFDENELAGENIFKVAIVAGNKANIGNNFWVPSLEAAYFLAAEDLTSLYDTTDVRMEVNFRIENGDQVVVNKYPGPESNPGICDAKALRTSEVMLNLAEAHYFAGNEDQARDYLDAVRAARIDNYTSLGESGDNLIAAIMQEKRKELAFEGFRFYDIKRWREDIIRMDCTSVNCELLSDNFRMIYPIPQSEVFANDNITQNEGYGS